MNSFDILVDARGTQDGFKQHKHRGIGHYAMQLIRHLLESKTSHHFTFMVDATMAVDPLLKKSDLLWHTPHPRAVRIPNVVEMQFSLPRTLRTRKFDVVHYLSQHDGALNTPFPFILNILDTVEQSAGHMYSLTQNLKNVVLKSMIQRIAQKASAIITISEYSKQDILHHYRLPSGKIRVTHLAADNRFLSRTSGKGKASNLASLNLPKKFLLYVGGIDPRKNIPTLLRALALLYERNPSAPPLAFAGRIDNQREYAGLLQEVEHLRLQHYVYFLGFVPDDQLPLLFHQAEAFVFPSLLEGFGLPVLQAMASGIPVIASQTSSIPEVAGDTVFYANMNVPEELARVISYVLTHPREASRKITEGRRRAKSFSWHQTAMSTINVYEDVAMNSPGRRFALTSVPSGAR